MIETKILNSHPRFTRGFEKKCASLHAISEAWDPRRSFSLACARETSYSAHTSCCKFEVKGINMSALYKSARPAAETGNTYVYTYIYHIYIYIYISYLYIPYIYIPYKYIYSYHIYIYTIYIYTTHIYIYIYTTYIYIYHIYIPHIYIYHIYIYIIPYIYIYVLPYWVTV